MEKTTLRLLRENLRIERYISLEAIADTKTANEWLHDLNIRDAEDRESQKSKLRKWFTSLRPVNNWIWCRGNKVNVSQQCNDEVRGNLAQYLRLYGGKHKVEVAKIGSTFNLPDYTSINELEQKGTK